MRNVMLQNSINLMVQPEFSPVNCPLSSAFANICQNLSFESLLWKVSLVLKVSKQCFVFGHFWLFSQNNQPTLDWKFKNDWTKRLQKIPRKINLSLSLAKRKLAEKNEWNLSNQSGEVTRASIYLTNCRRSFFFSVTLFRAWFYDNQFSKIKFNLLKILEASQKHTLTMLVKLQAFITQFNQFHPGCYFHIVSLGGCFWIYL